MKKIFYLILIGIMFVIPKNVFAEEHSISWRTVWGYTNRWNGGTLSTPSYTMPSPTSYSINGVDYWQYSHSDLPDANKFEYYYGTTQAKFDTGTTYTVSGYVGFFGTFYNASVDKEPLQTFILYTREIGASQDDEYECQYNITNQHGNLQYFYEFTCKDVKLYENTRFGVVATLQNRESNTSLISQKFDFVANDTNSKIDAMVEEQQKTNEKLDGINKNQQQTNEKLDEANETSKGIWGTIKEVLSNIISLPMKLVELLIDALKSLFVPTDEQLYEIINDSKELSENFGFVGESINFFINIFTSLLGMVNANGCIELPEFTIGKTSLFDSFTFWKAQNVCLNDNVILSNNINTIRTITSIVLVGLFINFASKQFFNILSKNESQNDQAQEILDRYK